jgi:AcrR family transcriptional regulator
MPRDSTDTRRRILDAAVAEFSAFGLAGARVDRIALDAGANKRSLYLYYESKDGLFNAAMHRVISEMVEAVPLTPDDLPGYAGRVFDYVLAHPEAVRMILWGKLERPSAGSDLAADYAAKVTAMAKAEDSSAIGLPPTDLIVLVYGLTIAWLTSPDGLLEADGSDPRSPQRLAAHRVALVEAARRLVAPAAA